MDDISRLEREIDSLNKKLKEQTKKAETERKKLSAEHKKKLEAYRVQAQRAIAEHDEEAKRAYSKMLDDYRRMAESDLNEQLAKQDARYGALLEVVKKSRKDLEKKRRELEGAINDLKGRAAEKEKGSAEQAKLYMQEANRAYTETEKKPHEKFAPSKLVIYDNAIEDGVNLYDKGLYEAVCAVAVSAKTGLLRLSSEIDEKTGEWREFFELFLLNLDFLSSKLEREQKDWDEYTSRPEGNAREKTYRAMEINYWSDGVAGQAADLASELGTHAARYRALGEDAYLKLKDGVSLDTVKEFIDRIKEADKKFEAERPAYKSRYSASMTRRDWAAALTEYFTGEINLTFRQDLSGFMPAGEDALNSKAFKNYAKYRLNDPEFKEDFRGWLRLVFEDTAGTRVFVYIYPVEENGAVTNEVIIHIDFAGAEDAIYAREILSHASKALGGDQTVNISLADEGELQPAKKTVYADIKRLAPALV